MFIIYNKHIGDKIIMRCKYCKWVITKRTSYNISIFGNTNVNDELVHSIKIEPLCKTCFDKAIEHMEYVEYNNCL